MLHDTVPSARSPPASYYVFRRRACRTVVSCAALLLQVGLRGYNATRQLLLAGKDAVNVSGGYRSWQQAKL